VSWNDAVEFCKKLTEMEKNAGRLPQGMSYQLPTEAQWEYACRAGTTTVYSWGDSISSSNANYERFRWVDSKFQENETTPVGKYPSNPWGFHDMHGNVREWSADWYGFTDRSGAVTDPEGLASGISRVVRGGAWIYDGSGLGSAERGNQSPSLSGNCDYTGFRVSLRLSKYATDVAHKHEGRSGAGLAKRGGSQSSRPSYEEAKKQLIKRLIDKEITRKECVKLMGELKAQYGK